VLLAQQQHAEIEKMQSEARHLQEIAQRKAIEEKMAQVSFIPEASAAVDNRMLFYSRGT